MLKSVMLRFDLSMKHIPYSTTVTYENRFRTYFYIRNNKMRYENSLKEVLSNWSMERTQDE